MTKPIHEQMAERFFTWLSTASEADISKLQARLRLHGDLSCGINPPDKIWIEAGYEPPKPKFNFPTDGSAIRGIPFND